MLSKSEKKFTLIYSLIVIAELISEHISSLTWVHYLAKPAIVVSLLLFFWTQSQALNQTLRILVILALFFSLIGDVLLMFVQQSPNYFLFGLIAFLLAHVMYVTVFLRDRNSHQNTFGFIIILLIYALGLFYFLKDGLNEMLIPVIVYMLVILSMATTAYIRRGNVPKTSYVLVLIGAFLFMLSDSILAMNKFYQPLYLSGIGIMLTYALAQYFIVLGLLKLVKNSN